MTEFGQFPVTDGFTDKDTGKNEVRGVGLQRSTHDLSKQIKPQQNPPC